MYIYTYHSWFMCSLMLTIQSARFLLMLVVSILACPVLCISHSFTIPNSSALDLLTNGSYFYIYNCRWCFFLVSVRNISFHITIFNVLFSELVCPLSSIMIGVFILICNAQIIPSNVYFGPDINFPNKHTFDINDNF